MALDRLERASLNRLYKNVAPIQNKIDRIKENLQKQMIKAKLEIDDLENQKALYQPMIDTLEAKDAETEETTETVVVEETTTTTPEDTIDTQDTSLDADGPGNDGIEGIPTFGSEYAETVPFMN